MTLRIGLLQGPRRGGVLISEEPLQTGPSCRFPDGRGLAFTRNKLGHGKLQGYLAHKKTRPPPRTWPGFMRDFSVRKYWSARDGLVAGDDFKHGFFSEPVPVSAFVVGSKNLKVLKAFTPREIT